MNKEEKLKLLYSLKKNHSENNRMIRKVEKNLGILKPKKQVLTVKKERFLIFLDWFLENQGFKDAHLLLDILETKEEKKEREEKV